MRKYVRERENKKNKFFIILSLLPMIVAIVILLLLIISKYFFSESNEIADIERNIAILITSMGVLVLFFSIITLIKFEYYEILNFPKKSMSKCINISYIEKTPGYNKLVNGVEKSFGKELKKYKSCAKILKIIIIISSLILFIGLFKIQESDVLEDYIITYLFISCALIAGLGSVYSINCKKYNTFFNNEIIAKIVENISSNLIYLPEGSEGVIDKYNEGFEDQFNMIEATNLIFGKINNIHIRLCKIRLLQKDSDGSVTFGDEILFSYTQLEFNVVNSIRIKPNNIKNINNKKRVDMDSEEFEKYFDVYSDSKILPMKILTHDVMEELYNFFNYFNLNIDFEIKIKKDGIYIKFYFGDTIFNISPEKDLIESDILWIYYIILEFTTNITIKINKLLKGTEV